MVRLRAIPLEWTGTLQLSRVSGPAFNASRKALEVIFTQSVSHNSSAVLPLRVPKVCWLVKKSH